MDAKKFYQSKTLMFNFLVAFLGFLTMSEPVLQEMLSAERFAQLISAIAVINSILRVFTDKPVK